MDQYAAFRANGYAIFRDVLDKPSIDALLAEADTLSGRWSDADGDPNGGVRWLSVEGGTAGRVLRGVQTPHRISRTFDAVRTDRRILAVLEPMLGGTMTSIVSTLFWKPPGEPQTAIAYHQDCAFREPAEQFRRLGESYAQLGLALDPHGPDNGGLRVVAGSHKRGDLSIRRSNSVMRESPEAMDLAAIGLAACEVVDIRLDPGDVVVWGAYTLHGSLPNTSPTLNRRFFVVAYMRSSDCDAGEPAFVDSEPRPWRPPDGQAESTTRAGRP